MVGELCGSCGKTIELAPGLVSVRLNGYLTVEFVDEHVSMVPLGNFGVSFCEECSRNNRVPCLEAALFDGVVKAQRNSGGNSN